MNEIGIGIGLNVLYFRGGWIGSEFRRTGQHGTQSNWFRQLGVK